MRVESKPTGISGMGKRKHKLRKQQKNANEFPDSSDENGVSEATSICTHLAKAVNLNLVKKAIKNLGLSGECTACKSGLENSKNVEGNVESSEAAQDTSEYTVWLCLQCGNQGCDRNSKNRHALKHYDTPRSSAHDIVLNLTTFVVWCYGCDDEVLCGVSKKLSECLEFVKKQLGVASTQPQTTGKKSSQHKSSEGEDSRQLVTVEKEDNVTQGNTGKYTGSQTQLVLPKVKGLSNLGNTCFFNAVMQNLSQTPVLASILSEQGQKGVCVQLPGQLLAREADDEMGFSSSDDEMKVELSPLTIRLEDGGALTHSVMSFMTDMSNYTAKSQVITPSGLFGQVCKKAPRFKGFQQQDSHELLRYLLDGMKAEEIKRCQAGILKAFSVPQHSKHVDEETKVKVKSYGTQVKHTFVDSVFGGAFISTVQCEECHFPSQILEPFLDISLPVTEEKTIRPGNLGRKQLKSTDLSAATEDKPIESKPAAPSKYMKKKERKESKKKKSKKHDKKGGAGDGDKTTGVAEKDSKDDSKDVQEEEEDVEEHEEEEQEETMETQQGGEEDAKLVAASRISGDRSDTSADVVQGMSTANSEQNLADGQDEDSDADVEDNDDGCRNSHGEDVSNNLVNDLASTELATGLRGGNSDSLLTDSLHKQSENGASSCDVGKLSDEDEFRTSKKEVRQESVCCDTICDNNTNNTNNQESKLGMDDARDCYSDHVDSKKEIVGVAEKLLDSKPVNGMVKEITDSMKHVQIIEKNEAEIDSAKSQNLEGEVQADEEIEEEDQNIANINKNALSNSSIPNITQQQSPKLSRSSSVRSSSTNLKSRNQRKVEARTEAMRSLAPTRYQPDSHECSIQSCLNQFTAAELLTGVNKFGCANCSKKAKHYKDGKQQMVYTNASKQLLIFSPPAVLTLHLKRFQQVGFSLRKVNRHVDFPLLLDIAPYCSVLSQGVQPGQQKVLYSLYGIVEHSGRLTGGHYTAFVKVRPNSSTQVKAFLQYSNLHVAQLDQLLMHNMEAAEKQGAVGGVEEEGSLGSSPGKWYYISDSRVSETTESKVLACQAYLLFYERIG